MTCFQIIKQCQGSTSPFSDIMNCVFLIFLYKRIQIYTSTGCFYKIVIMLATTWPRASCGRCWWRSWSWSSPLCSPWWAVIGGDPVTWHNNHLWLVQVDTAAWPQPFFYLTLVCVVILNIANGQYLEKYLGISSNIYNTISTGIYHNTVYGLAARLPVKYTGAVVLGSVGWK